MVNKDAVLKLFEKEKKLSFIDIAKKLKISHKENKLLTSLIFSLIDEFQLIKNPKTLEFEKITFIKNVVGTFKVNSNGFFGFIDPLEENGLKSEAESFYVSKNYFNKALDGDKVEAKIFSDINGKIFAMITNILNRNIEFVYGIIEQNKEFLNFKPINKKFDDRFFSIKKNSASARINDVVKAKILNITNHYISIDIIEKISNINDPMCYVQTLLDERKIPKYFPSTLSKEIENIPENINNENTASRKDYREQLIVTIDGDDTKDFDDAINVVKHDNGTYTLGVHIADVSHYVQENSLIDLEAFNRGTSIYLLNQVVPMLPFKLSNGICSLNPNEDRFTLSVIINYDKKGKVIDTHFYESIICSKYRLTYNNVNKFWKNEFQFNSPELEKMLNDARELAKLVERQKYEQGYIDFEIDEPYVKLDEKGNVLDILVKPSGESEKLIESFMVAANEAVAHGLNKLNIPVLFRIHDKPDVEKIDYFKTVLNALNINVKIDLNDISPKSFQNIIEEIKKNRNDDFIKLLFLRTMQKAIYSPNNIGHFGLASTDYCHFTSPIRRYPDLIVHRILKDVFIHKNKNKIEHYRNILASIAEHSSNTEQGATDVERDVNDLKFAEFYKNKIGKKFTGQIVSILKFGMFIEFDNKTDALVHISTIGKKDEFKANEQFTKLIGATKTYNLGQKVSVIIVNADEISGKVDAVLEEFYPQYLNNIAKKYEKRK
ncbi:ribonuclease R [Mycoplasmopsis hyopharyngis]|uniref:ribonuclease R n=1 Tax=Mycoplasmopsis hyopharyngis TaxID=29558 RepID=UPI003873177F